MIWVNVEGSEIVLNYTYNPAINQRVKKIFGWRFDPQSKTWRVPVSSCDELVAEFGCMLHFAVPYEQIKKAAGTPIWSKDDTDPSVVALMKKEPYDYQVEAATAFLPKVKTAILGDDVGLGKTCTALTAFSYLHSKGLARKCLVVCKDGLKTQWAKEITRFTHFRSLIIDGPLDRRLKLYVQAMGDVEFVIVNYELFPRSDDAYIRAIAATCDVIILDEAQKMSRYQTKTHRAIIKMDAPYKWALTGTPVENSPLEVYGLFRFIQPRLFGMNPVPFLDRYFVRDDWGHLNTKEFRNLADLRSRIAPYILRRKKADIERQLPSERIDYVYLDMTPVQTLLHETVRLSGYDSITAGDRNNAIGMFAIALQIADSPELLLSSDSHYAREIALRYKPEDLSDSPKADWICSFLEERYLSDPSRKTVVFSRSRRFVEILQSRLAGVIPPDLVVSYHGGLSNEQRQAVEAQFRDKACVFLATDAASEGLNLQVADVLVNVDLPYTPTRFVQRKGRIVRDGSPFQHVQIISLIMADSVDERIVEIIYQKQEMIDFLIETIGDIQLDAELLKKLLSVGEGQGSHSL